jgi:hypothetical protein
MKRIILNKFEGESNENFKNAEAEHVIAETSRDKVNDEAIMLDVIMVQLSMCCSFTKCSQGRCLYK